MNSTGQNQSRSGVLKNPFWEVVTALHLQLLAVVEEHMHWFHTLCVGWGARACVIVL